MQNWKISPKHDCQQLAKGEVTPIDVFEEQVRGWVLEFAEKLAGEDHAGIAVLMLASSYFEPIACFLEGKDSRKREGEFFKKGVATVFPELAESPHFEKVANLLYEDLRCGLFHGGMIRGRIVVVPEGEAIKIHDAGGKVDFVEIHAPSFLKAVAEHFEGYVTKLREAEASSDIRKNFEVTWKSRAATSQLEEAPASARVESWTEMGTATNVRTPPSPTKM